MEHKESLKKAFSHGMAVMAYLQSGLNEKYAPLTFESWYDENFYNYKELIGTQIEQYSYTHSNRNQLVIEVLGEENYIGNNIKNGDKLKVVKI